MAIAMILHWEGISPAQYDEVRAIVDWEHDQPEGGRLHIAAFDDTSLRVTDVWDSVEQFQHFADSRLMPGVAQVSGIETEPQIEILPLHAVYSPALQHAIA